MLVLFYIYTYKYKHTYRLLRVTSILWLALSNLTASLWCQLPAVKLRMCEMPTWTWFGSGWGEVEVVCRRTLCLKWLIYCMLHEQNREAWTILFYDMVVTTVFFYNGHCCYMYDGVVYEMKPLVYIITVLMQVWITIIRELCNILNFNI